MYNEFYGLSEKPFELLPDPKFLFLTTSHREIIASMMGRIRNGRDFISITGEVGTGKTTLIRYLLGKFEDEEKVKTVLIFHPTITFKELLKSILLDLNLEAMQASKGTLLRQLDDYLTQMSASDEVLVIIIDEAQDLSREAMEELGMLPKIATLRIIFVGQPEFEKKLNSQGLRQIKQRIGITYQIGPFSEEESKNYIDHRLRMVRSSSSERFTPKAISMICSHAKGIPRIINILCDNAFQMGHSLSRKKIDVDIIREVIKDREGPFLQNTFLSGISSAVTAVKEFRLFSPRLNSLFSKAFLIVLSSLCLGGFVFLIDRYFQPRPAKTWDIKSIKSPSVNIQPSLGPPSSQNLTGEISGSNTSQLSVEPKPISPEFPKPASPPNAPLTPMSEEDQSMKIVTIKRGQTIYSLTKECYRMVNRTLMDFILDLNPEVTDVHLILVDQKIMIPTVTEKLLVIKSADNTYKIHAGTFPTPGAARLYTDERALKGKKVETFSRKVSPRDTWFRVVIGKFESEAEVLGMIGLLKEKGLLPAFGGPLKIE